jgi:FlaA1/EpsC-like NDP-sugar epimerase
LITLSGLQPDRDIEIKISGVRPGEKLQERLFLEGEDYETTQHEKIFVFKGPLPLEGEALHHEIDRLIQLAQGGGSAADIWAVVHNIVPECGIDLKTSRFGEALAAGSDPGPRLRIASAP